MLLKLPSDKSWGNWSRLLLENMGMGELGNILSTCLHLPNGEGKMVGKYQMTLLVSLNQKRMSSSLSTLGDKCYSQMSEIWKVWKAAKWVHWSCLFSTLVHWKLNRGCGLQSQSPDWSPVFHTGHWIVPGESSKGAVTCVPLLSTSRLKVFRCLAIMAASFVYFSIQFWWNDQRRICRWLFRETSVLIN